MDNDLGDLLFEAKAGQRDLTHAIGALYRVPPETVRITGFYDLTPLPEGTTVFVQRDDKRGDYPILLAFWPRTVELPMPRLEGVRFLTRTLDAACILDAPGAPHLDLRVWPDGRVEQVVVDEELMDETDEVRVRPLSEVAALS